jgi:hypothetical protein
LCKTGSGASTVQGRFIRLLTGLDLEKESAPEMEFEQNEKAAFTDLDGGAIGPV